MDLAAARNRRLEALDSDLPVRAQRRGAYETVLKTALRLFAERGFGGTSVRDLAAAAAVQPATLYAHFPSKDHVLAELIKIGHEEHFNRLKVALLESQPDPREQIVALVRAHVLMHVELPTLAVVANAELHACAPELIAGSLDLRRQSEQMFQDVIDRGIRLGLFKVPHAWLAMAMIAGAGLRVSHWYAPSFDLGAGEVADVYARMALRVLGVTD